MFIADIDPDRTYALIKDIVEIALVPYLLYLNSRFKKIEDNMQEMHDTLISLKVTLVGPTGNNGLNSRVNKLETWREKVSSTSGTRIVE
jgi:hypothetical protein